MKLLAGYACAYLLCKMAHARNSRGSFKTLRLCTHTNLTMLRHGRTHEVKHSLADRPALHQRLFNRMQARKAYTRQEKQAKYRRSDCPTGMDLVWKTGGDEIYFKAQYCWLLRCFGPSLYVVLEQTCYDPCEKRASSKD